MSSKKIPKNPYFSAFLEDVNEFLVEKHGKLTIINEQCNKCGICAQVCPAKNITVAGKVDFRDQCEGCSACLHLCPKNALHLKNEKSNKRWRHPDVSLKELIEANDRG
jgi:MinD superfamily P-loop ATPase